MKKKSVVWWGTFSISENQTHFWEIGPLLLGLERRPHEWRIAQCSLDNSEMSDVLVNTEKAPETFPANLDFQRYVFGQTNSTITLTPILADRAQVSRPEIVFYLPSQEKVTIYVSSPVWIRIEAGSSHLILNEIPSQRLSDTWFGPNTREGELCYSSKTYCRTDLANLPLRPHRVLTPVTIHNHAKDPLLLEQLSLPLPYLSTYVDDHGYLWTEEITVVNEAHQKSHVRQEKGAPKIVKNAKLISNARHHLKSSNLMTLFYSLLTE